MNLQRDGAIEIAGKELDKDWLRNIFRQLFWKQSETLRTDESCEEEAERVVGMLAALQEENVHYATCSDEFVEHLTDTPNGD